MPVVNPSVTTGEQATQTVFRLLKELPRPDKPCLIMVKVLTPRQRPRTSATDPAGAGRVVPYGR